MTDSRLQITDYPDVLQTQVFEDEESNIKLLRCVKLAQELVRLIRFFENKELNVDFLLTGISKSTLFTTFLKAANDKPEVTMPELGINTLLSTQFNSLTEKRSAILRVRGQLTEFFHQYWDVVSANWQRNEIFMILDLFDRYMPYSSGNKHLTIEYKQSILVDKQLTLLGHMSKQDVLIEVMGYYPQLVNCITKEALNVKLYDDSSPLACFCFSGRDENDRTAYHFFTQFPELFQKIEIDEFKRISTYLTPLNFGVSGKDVKLKYSIATLMCEQRLDHLFDARLHDAIDDAFINNMNNLLLLIYTGYFLRHPEKIKQIKSSGLQQVIPEAGVTIAELFVNANVIKIQEYIKLEPALINEFNGADKATLLKRHRLFFKTNKVEFQRKVTEKEKPSEPVRKAKSVQVKKLSADEQKLKKALLGLGFIHYEPDELKPNGFTTTQRDKLLEVRFKFSDKDVIENVLNEFIDDKIKNKFTYKIIEKNEKEFDFYLIGAVDAMIDLFSAVLHKDKQNIRKQLLALGYIQANLQSEQVKGFHISIDDKFCTLKFYGYKAADVSKIMKVKNTAPYINSIKAILGNCAAGGFQLLTLRGKTTILADMLQSGGEQLMYNENPTVATSSKSKNTKKKKVTPTIDETIWNSVLKAVFHHTTIQVNYHQDAVKPYIEVTYPQLNSLWIMREGDVTRSLLVTDSILRKTLIPSLQHSFSEKVKVDDTAVGKILIYPENEKPTLKAEVNKVSLAEIVTLNQSRPALLEEAFDKAKYERFFNTVFCHASGLKISWVCEDDVYVEVFYPPLDAAWEVEDVNKMAHNFYVKQDTLESYIIQRITSHLTNAKLLQVKESNSLKIFVRANSVDFDTTALHKSVHSDLFAANKEREEEILGISIKGSNRVKFVMREFKHQSNQENITNSKDQEAHAPTRSNPYETTLALKNLLCNAIPNLSENHRNAFTVEALQIHYDTSSANSFGCLKSIDVVNIAVNVINENQLFANLSESLLSCSVEKHIIHIKLIDKTVEHIDALAQQLPQISKDLNERYEQAIQKFMDERMQAKMPLDNVSVQEPVTRGSKSTQSNYEKSDNFFVNFCQAMKNLLPEQRELLTYHYTEMCTILNTSHVKYHEYYHQVYRAHLVRFLALIGEVTNNHNHLNLVRDFVRHDLRKNKSNEFKEKCHPFIKLIADFAKACPANNDFSIHIFQELYIDYASNLTAALSSFANLNRNQAGRARYRRREKHEYLKGLLLNIDKTDLNETEKRDATLSILCDIGESTSEKLIKKKGEEKDFFALCKQIFQIFGHRCFDVDYNTFANEQYQLYLNYLKSKNPAQERVDAPEGGKVQAAVGGKERVDVQEGGKVQAAVGVHEIIGLAEQSFFTPSQANMSPRERTLNPAADEYVPVRLRNTQSKTED